MGLSWCAFYSDGWALVFRCLASAFDERFYPIASIAFLRAVFLDSLIGPSVGQRKDFDSLVHVRFVYALYHTGQTHEVVFAAPV